MFKFFGFLRSNESCLVSFFTEQAIKKRNAINVLDRENNCE
jgi:hypothetical protein